MGARWKPNDIINNYLLIEQEKDNSSVSTRWKVKCLKCGEIRSLLRPSIKNKEHNCDTKKKHSTKKKIVLWQPGDIINNYEIIERNYEPPWKSHETAWKTKCLKCEEINTFRKSQIEHGEHDCNHEKWGRGHKKTVCEAGIRYGSLVTTGRCESRKSYTGNSISMYLEVQCDCGSDPFFVRQDHLKGRKKNGYITRTISCGCKSVSSGELKIQQILDNLVIEYQQQYKIAELSEWMRFDFAIFEGNKLKCLIEYDGAQHRQAIDYFGGEEKLKIQQERDNRKNKYCIDKGIKLIRIPDTDFNKLDEEYLKQLIFS